VFQAAWHKVTLASDADKLAAAVRDDDRLPTVSARAFGRKTPSAWRVPNRKSGAKNCSPTLLLRADEVIE
jgi:hypothetical protein